MNSINLKTEKLFIVDDDPIVAALYEQCLKNDGYEDVVIHSSGVSCLNDLNENPAVIFLDQNMEDLDGLQVLNKIKRQYPDAYVVFISGQDDIKTAVNSLKHGAFDYIVKGEGDTERILHVLARIERVQQLLIDGNKKKGFLRNFLSLFV